ncbi:MAG: ABC transporter substrate-binding protein [Chloroflexota bacterium]
MADAIKAFDANKAPVAITFIAAANATQALVAHQIDALFVGAASIIAANVNGHEDLVYLASLDNHSSFALFGQPSVNTPADLKGKVVASDRPGTTFDYIVRVALDQLGLKPTDVDIRALGNSSVVYEALIGGQAAAAPLAPPFSFQAQAKGYKLLKDEYSIAYQDVGVVVSKSQLARIGPQMPGFLTAIRQGIDAYNSQPDVAIKVLQQYTKETDQVVLQKTYDFYKSTVPFEKSMRPTLDGIKAMIDFLSTTIPEAKNASPQQFVDTSYLDKLNLPS